MRIRPDSIIADHKAAEPSQGVGRVLGHFYEAALSCTREVTGANGRTDVDDIIRLLLAFGARLLLAFGARLLLAFGARLLLAFGADPNQRGINDYTPLHMAVAERNPVAVQTLLDAAQIPSCARGSTSVKRLSKWQRRPDIRSLRRCWRAKGSRFAQPRHPERTTIR